MACNRAIRSDLHHSAVVLLVVLLLFLGDTKKSVIYENSLSEHWQAEVTSAEF